MTLKHSVYDLTKFFSPHSIAIIGASNKQGKVGAAIVKNLLAAKFSGLLYPVSLTETKIHGLVAYKNISAIKSPVELAIIAVPAPIVPQVARECAHAKIKNILIISAGFSETGEAGAKLEKQLAAIVEKYKLRVIGPNSLGVINTALGLNASFAATYPKKGTIAVVSQSGALCTALLDWAKQESVGFSTFISTGNKTFLNEADYFKYLANDPTTSAVIAYMESVKNPEQFLREATLLAQKKPVIVLKSGRTKEGQHAARSHTGALTIDDSVFSVACKKANLVRVNSIEGLFDITKLLSALPAISGFRLAVVTNAGGPGVIAADSASAHHFPLPELSKATLRAVKTINPNAHNPLDLIGDARPVDYATALSMLQEDDSIDIVYCILTPQSMTDPEKVAEVIVSLNTKKPIICSFIGGTSIARAKQYLEEHGVADFDTPERGIKALARVKEYYERKKVTSSPLLSPPIKPKPLGRLKHQQQLTLKDAFTLFNEVGIKTPRTIFATTTKEIERQAKKIRYPAVLKTASGLAHKTNYGLVKTGINSREELLKEAEKMFAKHTKLKIKPLLAIQETVAGKEVLISAVHSEFGNVITYGLGGIFVEVLKDFSQKIVPLSHSDVDALITEVKASAILMGARQGKKYDIPALKKTIRALSLLALAYPALKEIEINPLIVTEKGCVAVDAVITQ